MNFGLTPEQAELKRSARRFLESHCGSARVRAAMETERGWDEAAWNAARELGWPALTSLGWGELVIVAEEAGRCLACLPFFSSVCLAANALDAAGDDVRLRRVESGEIRAALASGDGLTARQQDDGYVLSGAIAHVVDGHTADLLVVAAGAPDPSLFVVDPVLAGVTREKKVTMDPTRAMATVTLRDVSVPASARIGGAQALQTALHRAAVALAAESLGGAERCVEMATEYAKTRIQFDRPIGSFQAIKHRLADMFVAVETARSAVTWAASVAATGDASELPVAAALAKSYCTEAFFRCAAECIQIHGGIGFTWEHDAHLFLRRARGSLALLGSPSKDRESIARATLGCED
jgi:alkylation response protein AidB-like acyl-CoA dehydrogenase